MQVLNLNIKVLRCSSSLLSRDASRRRTRRFGGGLAAPLQYAAGLVADASLRQSEVRRFVDGLGRGAVECPVAALARQVGGDAADEHVAAEPQRRKGVEAARQVGCDGTRQGVVVEPQLVQVAQFEERRGYRACERWERGEASQCAFYGSV